MEQSYLYQALPFLKEVDRNRQKQFEVYFKNAPLWILDAFQVEEMEKDVTFIRENEPADTIYFIVKGLVKATDYRVNGITYDFMLADKVHAFGGMEFILDNEVYRTTLQTVTKCTVAKIPRDKFAKWMYSDIRALKYEARLMGEELLEEVRTNRLYLFLQGGERLALLLVERYERYSRNGVFHVRGGRQTLADATGLCVKSITRAVKKFADDGLISKEGSRITVNREQYEGLKELISLKIDR